MTGEYLILHGLEGSGPGHWQTWLASRLRGAGKRVRYPALPEPFDPDPDAWHEALTAELAAMSAERVVICHSLACLLWLRHTAATGGRAAERVLLVAPPCTAEVPAVARFLDIGATAATVARAASETLVVCSDADPYCPPGAVPTFAEPLAIPAEVVPGGGHLNPDAGFGPWPAAERWALYLPATFAT